MSNRDFCPQYFIEQIRRMATWATDRRITSSYLPRRIKEYELLAGDFEEIKSLANSALLELEEELSELEKEEMES